MPEVTVAQAAAMLGTSVDTIRRRVKRGELKARRNDAGAWLVELPNVDEGAGSTTHDGDLAAIQADLERTKALLEETRRSRDELSGMVGLLREQLQAAMQAQQRDAEERSELRKLLAQAQSNVNLLLPAPSTAEQMPSSKGQQVHSSPLPWGGSPELERPRWWQFWRPSARQIRRDP